MAVHVYITEIRFLVTINDIKTNKHVHVDNADLTLFADDSAIFSESSKSKNSSGLSIASIK